MKLALRRRVPGQGPLQGQLPILGVIAAGGALGALARYGMGRAVPSRAGSFPWATFAINLTGCLLIGVLMVLILEVWSAHRLLRPFLGTGVLGGYTTFSTYAVDALVLMRSGRVGLSLGYLIGTLAGALAAVWSGIVLARWATRASGARRRA